MVKKDIEIKLADILEIEKQLNGIKDQSGNKIISGIFEEKLPLIAKYWLDELKSIIVKEKEIIDKNQNELIIKHGKANEQGVITIPVSEKDDSDKEVYTLAYVSFFNEMNELLSQTKTISYYPIKLELLKDLVTDKNYTHLYKFFEV